MRIGGYSIGQAMAMNRASRGALKIAMIGDSITDQNSRNIRPPTANPSRAWFTDGFMTWARAKTRQRIIADPDGDFGVSGNTIGQMLARVGDVIAYRPSHCIVLGGTNDFPATSYEQSRLDWENLIGALQGANICPIIMPPPPSTGILTDANTRKQSRFTNHIREYSRNNRGQYYVDYLSRVTDQTNALSPALANMLKADGTHPAALCAYNMGDELATLLNAISPEYQSDFSSAVDYYHATDNPGGNLLYSGTTNRGLLAGTGGTQTADGGLTYAGALAAGWTFIRSGSSTCTVTLTKEDPRTDSERASGARQLIEIAASSGGDADEVYNLRIVPPIADIAIGDTVYAEVGIEIINAPSNMWALELYLVETRPTNSQTAIDMSLNSTLAGMFPAITGGLVLRTPTIVRQDDSTAYQWNVRARMKTDAGAASIKFAVGDPQMRKVL
jgi:lysophospholipase L1-like esterase